MKRATLLLFCLFLAACSSKKRINPLEAPAQPSTDVFAPQGGFHEAPATPSIDVQIPSTVNSEEDLITSEYAVTAADGTIYKVKRHTKGKTRFKSSAPCTISKKKIEVLGVKGGFYHLAEGGIVDDVITKTSRVSGVITCRGKKRGYGYANMTTVAKLSRELLNVSEIYLNNGSLLQRTRFEVINILPSQSKTANHSTIK
jgi:hypothetical protein